MSACASSGHCVTVIPLTITVKEIVYETLFPNISISTDSFQNVIYNFFKKKFYCQLALPKI